MCWIDKVLMATLFHQVIICNCLYAWDVMLYSYYVNILHASSMFFLIYDVFYMWMKHVNISSLNWIKNIIILSINLIFQVWYSVIIAYSKCKCNQCNKKFKFKHLNMTYCYPDIITKVADVHILFIVGQYITIQYQYMRSTGYSSYSLIGPMVRVDSDSLMVVTIKQRVSRSLTHVKPIFWSMIIEQAGFFILWSKI